MRNGVLASATVALLGCGGSGGGSLSCDFTQSGQHVCQDYMFSLSSEKAAGSATCKQEGGTEVSACSHAGAMGGCEATASDGQGHTVTQTTWYYDLTAAQVMSACTSANYTYVAP